jgi:hypothetical protein
MIKLEMFKGIAPRYAPQVLPDQAAQTAQNCRFDAGALRAYKGLSASVTTVDVNAKTIFLYNRGTPTWLNFTADTDIVRSPIAKDAYDRIYLSDGSQAKMKVSGSATLYDLGIPIPVVSGVSVNVDGTASPDPPTEGTEETRYYVITYVSAYDEEGPPSAPLGPYTWAPGEHVDFTNLPTGPGSGTTNLDRKRIYRTNTGSTSTEYQLVATISLATTSYEDAVASTTLGVILPSVTWDGPPVDIKGLCLHPSGFAVGYKGRTVYCSELYLPHAWPYSYPVASDIVAVGVFGNSILVTTKDMPYIISGSSPDSMMVEKTEVPMACVSKRSMVDMGNALIYASPEGLVGVGLSEGPQLLTENIFSIDTWAAYAKDDLLGVLWDGKYLGFSISGNKGFIFNPSNSDFVDLSIGGIAEAMYFDSVTGKLYVKLDNETAVKEWNAGSALTHTWKSKVYRLDKPRNFGVAQVFADAYPVTFMAYAGGVLKHTQTVASSSPFRMPAGFLSDIWEFTLTGTANVNAAFIAENPKQLQELA